MDMENKNKRVNKGGRKPKIDKANFRYTVNFTEKENVKFMALYRQSETKVISKFISAMIFGREMKIVKIDKATMDYYMRLTSFYSQFQAIGVNYNQTVKAIKTNFSEKRALILLRQLEKATFELVAINKQIVELTAGFERKHLIRNS
jgi:hypothetical protein